MNQSTDTVRNERSRIAELLYAIDDTMPWSTKVEIVDLIQSEKQESYNQALRDLRDRLIEIMGNDVPENGLTPEIVRQVVTELTK